MVDTNPIKKEATLQERVEREILNKPTEQKPISNKGPLKTLRTYQGDIEEILSKTNGSVASVAIAETRRKDEERKEAAVRQKDDLIPETKAESVQKSEPIPQTEKQIKASKTLSSLPQQQSTDTFVYNTRPEPQEALALEVKNRFFFSVGVALLSLGIVILGIVYYMKSKDTIVAVNQEKTIISYTDKKEFNIASSTKKDFVNFINKEKQNLKPGTNSVLYIRTTDGDSVANIKNVMTIIAPRMPSELSRSLSEKYMFGIYSMDTSEPFILLTGNDFGLNYSGLLQWEKGMASDLGAIFSLPADATVTFEDEALKNKDLRIVRGQDRKTVLLYTFLDKNTILITSNEGVFSAILGKFTTSQVSR
jgi:hypothetical protein